MAIYHPPKIITNNAAPSIAADLAYEAHGKCGITRVIRSDTEEGGGNIFDSESEGTANAWKMGVINVGGTGTDNRCDCRRAGAIRTFRANNMSIGDCEYLQNIQYSGDSIPLEIMADITHVELDGTYAEMVAILYIDCEQS